MRVVTWASLIWLSVAVGCGSTPPSPRSVRSTPSASPTPQSLAWSPSGDRLIVDQRLSVPVDGRAPARLPHLDAARVIFAADGRVAQLAPGVLVLDGARIALPTIQSPPVPDVEVTGFWLDLHRLYVHEWHPIKQASACRLFDRRTGGLRTLARCVTPGRPLRLQGGPGNLVAVHEAGSAGPVLVIRRFTPDGPDAAAVLRYDLRPNGAVALAFDANGGAVHLVSDCDLRQARPCVGPARFTAPWHVRYDVLEGKLTPLQAVQTGAIPSPIGRLAWPRPGQVCLNASPGVRATCLDLAQP